jgi:hypothetical protein
MALPSGLPPVVTWEPLAFAIDSFVLPLPLFLFRAAFVGVR